MIIETNKNHEIFNLLDLKMIKIALENSIIEQSKNEFYDVTYEKRILNKINSYQPFKKAEEALDTEYVL